LDIALLEKSLNYLIQHNEVLRTLFIYDIVDEPQQVVLKKRNLTVHVDNIADLPVKEQQQYLENFLKKDRQKGLDLTKDHLMQVHISQESDRSFSLVWGFHHIVLDGWCLGIVFKDLLQVYRSLRQGKSIRLESAPAYFDYVTWLERQDNETGMRYWKEYLEGYEKQAVLPRLTKTVSEYQKNEYNLVIDEALTHGLEKIARENHVTLNIVFQTIWGLLLQKYNNTDDVVFGAVVSGRPADLDGIERMLGLFINTVPVRIKTPAGVTFSSFLKNVQDKEMISRAHEYFPLKDIQEQSHLKDDLIDSIIIYENYPIQDVFAHHDEDQALGFTVTGVKIFEQTDFNFTVAVIPGRTIALQFTFNSLVYSEKNVQTIGLNVINIIKQVAQNPVLEITGLEMTADYRKKEKIMSHLYDDLEEES
jgi:hypothetical protein